MRDDHSYSSILAARYQAVLFDADGVLQFTPHDWSEALDAVGGAGFCDLVFEREIPAMRGEACMRDTLSDCLKDVKSTADVDDVLALWQKLRVDDEAVAIVDELRAAGLRRYLATNQQDVRVDFMRGLYAGHFDEMFFSCELGACKPQPEFFERILERIELNPSQCIFIDDSRANVEVAGGLGISAVWHDPASGSRGMKTELGAVGA